MWDALVYCTRGHPWEGFVIQAIMMCTSRCLFIFPHSFHNILYSIGHDKACDYWSWAILVHEMCTGDTPFQDHGYDQMTLFKGTVKGQYRISPLTTD